MYARRAASVVRAMRPRMLRGSAAAGVAKPAVNQEIAALEAKAKGPWNQLTIDDKLKLYRAAYSQTRAEITNSQGGYANPVPHTISKEWEDKAQEIKKEKKINPISQKH